MSPRREEAGKRANKGVDLSRQVGGMTVLFLCLIHNWDFTGKDLNSQTAFFSIFDIHVSVF